MKKFLILLAIFIVGFVFERELGLNSLVLWLISYLAYRKSSLFFLVVAAFAFDLLFVHALGSTLIFMSTEMLLLEFMSKRKISKKFQWTAIMFFIALYNSLLAHAVLIPLGFMLSSTLFFLPFVYRISISDLFLNSNANSQE